MTISKPLRFVFQIGALATLITAGTTLGDGLWTAAPWFAATIFLLALARQPIAKD